VKRFCNSSCPNLPPPTGSWNVNRHPGLPHATAESEHHATVDDLITGTGLCRQGWASWLLPSEDRDCATVRLADGREKRHSEFSPSDPLARGQRFRIPNVVLMVWAGALGGFGRWNVAWKRDRQYLQSRGFFVEEIRIGRGESNKQDLLDKFKDGTRQGALHGVFMVGHGQTWNFGPSRHPDANVDYFDLVSRMKYKLALVLINACHSGWARGESQEGEIRAGGKDLIAPHSHRFFHGKKGVLWPQIGRLFPFDYKHVEDVLPPGEQYTHP
jgi:hypothetical protein